MFKDSKKRILLLISVIPVAIGGLAFASFPGSSGPFLLFNLCYLSLLFLVFPRPRSYAYIFFAAFLFLGFWAKLMTHMIFNYSFLEPIGYFDSTGASWDRALIAASCASLGVIAARIIHLHGLRNSARASPVLAVPGWYSSHRLSIWSISCLLILGVNAWNLHAAFYQIGVNPRLVLPFHLNVLTAWLINIGFAIWLAVIVHWESLVNPGLFKLALISPMVEGLVSTCSSLSRSIYLFHSVPYLLVLFNENLSKRQGSSINKIKFATLLIAGLALSLLIVQVLRSATYFPAPSQASENVISANTVGKTNLPTAPDKLNVVSSYVPQMAKEIPSLFVDRWIGLEGVLAVSSYPNVGYTLFLDGLRENPKKGNNTYYQLISKSDYVQLERFTFLTLPGIAAILYYSGSLLAVAAGMLVVSVLMMMTELLAAKYLGNPFLLSLVGLAMTNVVCQLNFPYLGLIFFLQLWAALFFIWVLQAISARFASQTEP